MGPLGLLDVAWKRGSRLDRTLGYNGIYGVCAVWGSLRIPETLFLLSLFSVRCVCVPAYLGRITIECRAFCIAFEW